MRVRSRRARRAAGAGALAVLFAASTAGEARATPVWTWPVEGAVIAHYVNDDANAYAGGMHRGIDIAAATGTPVRAARAGDVTYAGALGYSGKTVAVRTMDGYVTSYLHLASIGVRRGETIEGGARIGEVGTTGRRSRPQPHLHFGVRRAGEQRRYVDPLTLLPPLPRSRPAPPVTPVPATVPAAPQPAPVRAVAEPRAIPVARRAAPRPVRVPVAPAPRRVHVPVAPAPAARQATRDRPVPRPAPAPALRAPGVTADWGRPLALAGLGLLVLALCGRGVLRGAREANRAVSGRAYEAIIRALRPVRAYRPRWR